MGQYSFILRLAVQETDLTHNTSSAYSFPTRLQKYLAAALHSISRVSRCLPSPARSSPVSPVHGTLVAIRSFLNLRVVVVCVAFTIKVERTRLYKASQDKLSSELFTGFVTNTLGESAADLSGLSSWFCAIKSVLFVGCCFVVVVSASRFK
ncbi:hypothetical protein BCR44DRAFT_39862 [Catenaria anguillulae PL171]|uniref:Uncharacterized protein n=1 Tax=Catenaria anguillulae PL171 TaxID=765915 RepID=A0A1Y2H6Z0_9FUNG|nr:hypothetical protein BCR44DRAFT_39862 [Catenaria anguillulae PL171]